MKWEGITEFVYVAENESFTLASKKLEISTAQVSRQVSALEKRLNIKLFYRTTRKVTLTEEGKLFYTHCRAVLDGLDAAERSVSNLQSKPQGNINLTVPITYGEQYILPLVNDFIQCHPDVSVNANLSNLQIDLIEHGLDLAIRIGHLKDSTLMAKKIGKRTNYVCASPIYIEKFGLPDSLSELVNHNCLLGTRDYWHFIEAGKEKHTRVNGNIRYNNGLALVDAALKGIGIVQLPDYYVHEYIQSGELLTLLDKYQEPEEEIWAVYPQNRHLSPKIRLLVDYLAEHL